MQFDIVPAHDLALAEQAAVFNQAFTGYLVGWSDLDAAGLARFIRAQGIDLCYSRFVRINNALAGFGYINRTGNVSRIAAMGLVPDARRTGASSFVLAALLDEAKTRGDEAMVLEVFEQNLPALNLYRRLGFRPLMRLPGWRRAPGASIEIRAAGKLDEISLLAASQMRGSLEFPQIPWQVSRYAVTKLADARAYQLDNGCVVIGNPNLTPIRLHALIGPDATLEAPRIIVAGLIEKFPESEFFAPPIFPEQFGTGIFEPLGFVREPFNQFLMRYDLQ